MAPRVYGASFRPRASLGLLYLFGFFLLFCLLLAGPTLWHVLQTVPAGPEQQQIAEQSVRDAMRSRVGIAFALAAIVTLIGGRARLLPGTREP